MLAGKTGSRSFSLTCDSTTGYAAQTARRRRIDAQTGDCWGGHSAQRNCGTELVVPERALDRNSGSPLTSQRRSGISSMRFHSRITNQPRKLALGLSNEWERVARRNCTLTVSPRLRTTLCSRGCRPGQDPASSRPATDLAPLQPGALTRPRSGLIDDSLGISRSRTADLVSVQLEAERPRSANQSVAQASRPAERQARSAGQQNALRRKDPDRGRSGSEGGCAHYHR